MNAGHLQQADTPQTLYDHPRNEFVAGFIGSPSINLVAARLEQQDGKLQVTFGEHRLTVDEQVARNRSGLSEYVGRDVILGIRPEDFEDATLESDAPADRRLKVVCDLTEPLGSEVLVHFSTGAERIVSSAAAAEAGGDADVSFGGDGDEDAGASTRLVARVSPKSRIAEGSEIELAVDTTRLYFFDPENRAAI
jgi:multiple sugar transport system ATP-binding protein